MRRKVFVWLFVKCAVLVCLLLTCSTKRPGEQREIAEKPVKNILIWNSFDRIETSYFNVGSASFVQQKCPVNRCQIFTDRTALTFHQYDAVVMNMHEIHGHLLPEEEGFRRVDHQRFIFLTQESTRTAPLADLSRYDNYFNWTVTYKLDSDILLVYGRVKPKPSAPKNRSEVQRFIQRTRYWNKNYMKNKTKLAAWMVSHCHSYSERESYGEELGKYIDIEVIGRCGKSNFTCPRDKDWFPKAKCYERLAADYKFYLSFENSLCIDYATEKFFNILAHDLVPVVYGGANYSKLAPPHSFIDAMRFTPRQLARYLNRIANDDRLYNEFFWWKEHYEVITGPQQMVRNAYCDLCQKLHEDTEVKVYNLKKFWRHQCYYAQPWYSNMTLGTNSNARTDRSFIGWIDQ